MLIDSSEIPAFKQGYEAYLDGKDKSSNPWTNILRRTAEFRKIHWDMGYEKAKQDQAMTKLNRR